MLVIPQNYVIKSILLPLLIIAIIEAILKGIALYKAGNKKDVARFICIFIFNTCGLLPVIYLLLANNNPNRDEIAQENKTELPQKNNQPANINEKKVAKDTTKQVKTGKNTTSSKKSTKATTQKK